MLQPISIQRGIESGMACQSVIVTGDGEHFEATVVSAAFVGKSSIQRHQLVYQALGDRMKQEIHALSIKTYTPEQWAEGRA